MLPNARAAELPKPPVAATRPHVVTAPHGARRDDPYYWLRDDDRKDPAVIEYLDAENAYADALLAPLKPLRSVLYDEIVARIKPDDSTVPVRERGWWYYTRFETGKDYPIHARRPDHAGADSAGMLAASQTPDAGEHVLLDVNALAAGHDYFSVGDWAVSPDNRLLAWAEDDVGRRQYVVRIKNLDTGEVFADRISGVSPNLVWADDNRTLFYVENDPETLLTKRVKAHVLGTPATADTLAYEEPDDSFYMGIERTRDDKFICIGVESTVSSELRCAPAADPRQFAVLAPRERDVEYQADHLGDRWVIRTNAGGAKNFQLMTAPSEARSRAEWRTWIAADDAVFIEDFELFDGFTAVAERSNALERVRVLPGAAGATTEGKYLATDEMVYSMGLAANGEPDSPWLRYSYTSLTTPASTYEINPATGEVRLLKQQPVPGYDASRYATDRVWITARDGTRVPVSLVRRRDTPVNGTAPLLLYAYGSYGSSSDPGFSPTVPSLLDRGVIYAIAHIRGGQELGRAWYEDGKLSHKQHTFDDFVDVTRGLVAKGYAAPGRVAAYGGSAGGLLMGAVANQAPGDYRVILSQVPFVDVVTTMLDPSIPLTTNEYDEWGNPERAADYAWMLAYSPYDNLRAQAYPAMFVGTGLWDSQVQYWEPAKYVARLRTLDTGTGPVVFRINMDAGHGGKSGRFRRYREQAEMYAFMLDQMQATDRVE